MARRGIAGFKIRFTVVAKARVRSMTGATLLSGVGRAAPNRG